MRQKKQQRPVYAAERLEGRRMLVVYTGTANPDTIVVISDVSGPGQYTAVQINGGAFQSTNASVVTINALGGDDTVYFPTLRRTINTTAPVIEINLGEGNDFASNVNPATSLGSTANIHFGLRVNGGPGSNDTFTIDASDGAGYVGHTVKPGRVDFRVSLALGVSAFTFDATLENLEIDGSASPESFLLEGKSPALRVTVSGGGGNDFFAAGLYIPPQGSPGIDKSFSENGWLAGTTTLTGGDGSDEVRFYDYGAAAGTYTADPFNFVKAGHGFTYFVIESQRLEPAPGSTAQFNSMSSAIASTTVLAYGDACTVNLSFGNLTSAFHASLFGTGSVLNINDANDTGNDNYVLTAGKIEKNPFVASQVVTYFGTTTLTLNTGQGGTSTFLHGVAAGTTAIVNGGAGFDTFRYNLGNVDASILGPTFINGGGNIDEVSFYDALDTTAGVVTLDGNTFTDGFAHVTSGVERLIVEAGSGPGATLNVPRVTLPTTVTGTSATAINIGGGNLDANLLDDLLVMGGGQVTVDDRLDVDNDQYVVSGLSFRKTTPGAHVVQMSSVGAAILQAGDGDNYILVDQGTSNALSIHANGGNDRIEVADTSAFFVFPATIGIDTGPERTDVFPFGDRVVVNFDAGTPDDFSASVRFLNDDAVNDLTIRAAGRVQVPAGVALRATTLTNAGVIDLAGGALLLAPAAAANVRAWLTAGRNGGTWDGTGPAGAINSSTATASTASDAVGYGLGSNVAPTTVGSFTINAADTLVRHTLTGDANLDQSVGFADLVSLAQNYNANGRSWTHGDFDYDAAATVGFADLVSLAQNYNQGFTAATWALALQTGTDKRKPDARGAGKLTI